MHFFSTVGSEMGRFSTEMRDDAGDGLSFCSGVIASLGDVRKGGTNAEERWDHPRVAVCNTLELQLCPFFNFLRNFFFLF